MSNKENLKIALLAKGSTATANWGTPLRSSCVRSIAYSSAVISESARG